MRAAWVVWGLTTVIALGGDGGSRAGGPSGGLVTAAPPIPARAPSPEAEQELLRGSPRRAWAAFLSRLSRRPSDLGAAVGLVEAAERTGRIETALRQLAGLRRRHDAAALRVAELELRGPRTRGGRFTAVASTLQRGGGAAYVGLLRVATAIAAGDLGAMWRAVGSSLVSEPLDVDDAEGELSAAGTRRMLLRRQQLRVLMDGAEGEGAPDLARIRGLARAVGARHVGARLDLLLGVRAGSGGRTVRSDAHGVSALRTSVEEGRNSTTYMALAALRGRRNPRSHWGANPFPVRLCALVAPELARLRQDCRLTALEHAWKAGEFEAAMRLHDAFAEPGDSGHPVLRVRFAGLAVPLLKTVGRLDEAADLAVRALPVAGRLGEAGIGWQLRMHLAGLARHREDVTSAARWLAVPGPDADVPASVRVAVELERARVAALDERAAEVSRSLARAARAAEGGSAVTRRLVTLARVELDQPAERDPSPRSTLARLIEVTDRTPLDSLANEVTRGRIAEEREDLIIARGHYRSAIRWVSEVIRAADDPATRRGLVGGWRQLAEAQARISLQLRDPAGALEAIEALEGPPQGALHVREHLGRRDAVLVFRRVGEEVWCWILLDDGIRARRVPLSPERLRALVSLWGALLQRGGEGSLWREVGARVSAVLLEPLRSMEVLQGRARITVVARGALAGIPFDVLPDDGADDRLLGDRYVISRAGSLALLDATWHRRPRVGPTVAFGPGGSAAVLAEVAAVLQDRRGLAFTGPRATETRFIEWATESGLVHFGGHASAPGKALDEGGLVLRSTLVDDGLLSYREITDLDLRGASVVLLACDTVGAGGEEGGMPVDRPATLAEAFLVAGSRNVVGSLWPLSEAAAGEIAQAFYSAGGPEAGPMSLATAKRVLRRRYPESPERWAGAVWEGAPLGAGR